MNETIEVKPRPEKTAEPPLSATLSGTIEALSSRRGRYRLVIEGPAERVEELAKVARMQTAIVRVVFTEEPGE